MVQQGAQHVLLHHARVQQHRSHAARHRRRRLAQTARRLDQPFQPPFEGRVGLGAPGAEPVPDLAVQRDEPAHRGAPARQVQAGRSDQARADLAGLKRAAPGTQLFFADPLAHAFEPPGDEVALAARRRRGRLVVQLDLRDLGLPQHLGRVRVVVRGRPGVGQRLVGLALDLAPLQAPPADQAVVPDEQVAGVAPALKRRRRVRASDVPVLDAQREALRPDGEQRPVADAHPTWARRAQRF